MGLRVALSCLDNVMIEAGIGILIKDRLDQDISRDQGSWPVTVQTTMVCNLSGLMSDLPGVLVMVVLSMVSAISLSVLTVVWAHTVVTKVLLLHRQGRVGIASLTTMERLSLDLTLWLLQKEVVQVRRLMMTDDLLALVISHGHVMSHAVVHLMIAVVVMWIVSVLIVDESSLVMHQVLLFEGWHGGSIVRIVHSVTMMVTSIGVLFSRLLLGLSLILLRLVLLLSLRLLLILGLLLRLVILFLILSCFFGDWFLFLFSIGLWSLLTWLLV